MLSVHLVRWILLRSDLEVLTFAVINWRRYGWLNRSRRWCRGFLFQVSWPAFTNWSSSHDATWKQTVSASGVLVRSSLVPVRWRFGGGLTLSISRHRGSPLPLQRSAAAASTAGGCAHEAGRVRRALLAHVAHRAAPGQWWMNRLHEASLLDLDA